MATGVENMEPILAEDVRKVSLRHERYLTFQNIALWYFIIANIGLYYPVLLPLVWLSYGIVAVALGIRIYTLGGILKRNMPFIGITALFVLYSFMSVLWSYNEEYALESVSRMLRTVVVAWVLIIMVQTRRQWHMAMFVLALAGLINGLMYLQFVDLTKLAAARFNSQLASNVDGLPHLNVVAMYVAFAGVYFMAELTSRRHKPHWTTLLIGLLLISSIIIVFLFGSRKSILTIAAGIFLYVMAASSGIRKIQLITLVGIVVCVLIMLLPGEYIEFVLNRLFGTFDSNKGMAIEDRFRVRMIDLAFNYIAQAPIFGHGYYNFSELFGRDTGEYLYAHNNMLETLTDTGLIGFTIYYSLFFVILRNWYRLRKTNPSSQLVIVFMCLVILNGFLIVYLQEQFIWMLLALLYVGSCGFRSDADETMILSRKWKKVIVPRSSSTTPTEQKEGQNLTLHP